MPGDVSYLGLAISLVLVLVAVGLSVAQRLGIERSMLWAALRGLVQLLAIGFALGLILDPETPLIWSWLWIVVMIVIAADTVGRRAPEAPGIRGIAVVAFAAAAIVSLGVLFGFGIFPLEARALVPLSGMMIGNSMTATVVVARRIVEELRDKRLEVEARLALAQPSLDAARPYLRSSIRTALTPRIEAVKAVGIISLPGAMTGLILAGVDPVDAVRVQAAVMYLILGATATTTAVVAFGLVRKLFTPDHRLVELARPVDA
ncbi:MAG: iron export ABC transporter permease subunit FetB [Acidimicrobiia bacterium]|nr:iron export ABC transporter permease subunit FetB [Acidimicrobiia bacterium]